MVVAAAGPSRSGVLETTSLPVEEIARDCGLGTRPGRDRRPGVDGSEGQAARAVLGQHLDGGVDERRSPAVVPARREITLLVVVTSKSLQI